MAYTWLQFKNLVKSLMSDAALNNITAVLAISEFVKSYITLHVDKNPATSAVHMQNWITQRDRLLGYQVTMTTGDLRIAVNALLTVDANRAGIQDFIDALIQTALNDIAGTASFINSYITQGVIDLERFVEPLRQNQERVFVPADATVNGEACDVTLPEGCMIQDVYFVKDDPDCKRIPVTQYPWTNRFDLKVGLPRMNGHEFYAALSPDGRTATVFPTLLDGYHLSVFYDSLKVQFSDSDLVPFDDTCAMAVADYVRARQYIQIPVPNVRLAGVYELAYLGSRRAIYRDAKDRLRIHLGFGDTKFANTRCGCAVCSDVAGSGGSGSGSGSDGGCNPVQDVPTRQAMKSLPSAPCRHLVFILTPEPGVSRSYRYKHGDTTPADDVSVIAPNDDGGRYFEFDLS